ncbi:Uncharacterised protein [Chlamydia trachomatis]|nr:Uncharacterised protein [Chlamydia trachomatis]
MTIYVRLSSKFSRMLDLMITYKRLITFRTFNRIRYKNGFQQKPEAIENINSSQLNALRTEVHDVPCANQPSCAPQRERRESRSQPSSRKHGLHHGQ